MIILQRTELFRVVELFRKAHIHANLITFSNSMFVPQIVDFLKPTGVIIEGNQDF